MNPIRRLILVALPLGLFALSGCSGIGPATVVPSRFDYTAALGDSWKQQMLINMVKMRYGDAPVFLDVASVISQYQITAGANWGGTFNNPPWSNSQTIGGTGTYADRPTVTYMPLSGDKFTRTLMKPIPPPAILSLIQAGYPIDLVLRVCVHSVNGIRNRYGGSARARHADPGFYPLLERLRRIQDSGAIGLRVEKTGETEGVLMSFRGKVDASTQEDIDFVRKTLGLDPAAGELRIASILFGTADAKALGERGRGSGTAGGEVELIRESRSIARSISRRTAWVGQPVRTGWAIFRCGPATPLHWPGR